MAKNSDKYAAYSRPDKVRFIYRGLEPLEAVALQEELRTTVREMTGWSEAYTARHVRVMPYHRGKERKGVIFQLTYHACEACYGLALSWMGRVHEVEMKTYVQPRGEDSYDQFVDDVQASEGRLAVHVYYHGAHSSARKRGGKRKLDMGSRKSNSNAKVYKRPGERPGVEVTARGKAVQKIASETLEYADAVANPDDSRKLWRIFFERCARFGFKQNHAEMVRRGIDLADYFSDFTEHEDERFMPTFDATTQIERWKLVAD